MILTLTPNPSLDRTVELAVDLVPGGVHRIVSDTVQVGGKGVNVALGLARAGARTLAVVPVGPSDPFLALLERTGVPHRTSAVAGRVRTNLAVVDPSGTTTKINEPGTAISADELLALEATLDGAVSDGDLVMASGSLAPGMPTDWYAHLVSSLHRRGAAVGVDTSDAPLVALAEAWRADPSAAPDLIKPNAEELGQLAGLDGVALERSAEEGDLTRVAEAARALVAQGVGAVLVTLGAAGGLLATAEGAWACPAESGPVRSTVGAGDSAAAGYLAGRELGESEPERLARAVAYGTAAVALPGTTIPSPEQVRPRPRVVRAL
ncbi:1-phosphofructokinase family hexose kinase [Brachybacterium sp. DNPG3]